MTFSSIIAELEDCREESNYLSGKYDGIKEAQKLVEDAIEKLMLKEANTPCDRDEYLERTRAIEVLEELKKELGLR